MAPLVEEDRGWTRGRTGECPGATPSGASKDGLCFGASEQDQEEEHHERRMSGFRFVETLIA